MTLKLISLNAWGGRVHAPLMQYLKDADPDVLCLQEVTHVAGYDGGWLTFREGDFELPQRASLLEDVTEVLPGHQVFFAPAACGPLYDGDRQVMSEWGLATFVRQGLPVIGQAQGFIHGDFPLSGFGEHPRPRNAHGIRIFRHDTGSLVTIVQMHGLRDLAGKGDTPARLAQANALVGLIEKVWRPGEPLVVCGDLNLLPDSETFTILDRLGLTDLVTTRGFTDTRTSWYPKDGRYADYLLVTPNVKVENFAVVAEPEVSDHRALLLEIA
ncbi:endonuclease/exonuclease/phosphatase family metal-dependent hydrolase [Neorhizobium galegae]|uniref:endonuclease/exonuclease/phosphatase family protein n=1 Tax=Neorhizobium galegae TaxID=399 RepID=UPI001AE1FE32|nr:endonuclease/exonuclease/phosphatase family protein [Neorhizobium galegae]MBP2560289.1 endonuclease/exonuclease/phosphatase family metal-dependent hydrolase [Neorhizobium galegae]